jgi:glucose-6-phosphate isomerase
VLSKRERPNLGIQIDKLDERSLGALMYAMSFLTGLTGTLWGINPFDQPGVEEGKVYTRQALSQAGRGELRGTSRDSEEDDENSPVNRLRRDRGD